MTLETFYKDEYATIYCGDNREVLKQLPEASVDCVMTSPPYYRLRAYKCAPVIWDGDADCQHEWGEGKQIITGNAPSDKTTMTGGMSIRESGQTVIQGQFCLRCGAWRGVLGMEPTPTLYIQHLVGIFDDVRRVLKPTGTMFINISDSYAGGKGQSGSRGAENQDSRVENGESINKGYQTTGGYSETRPTDGNIGVPSKSLIGIPARFQIAMIDKGWINRNRIIWLKRSCMPESVSDRFTRDFEDILFFSANPKYYFEQQFENAVDAESYEGHRPRYAFKYDSDGTGLAPQHLNQQTGKAHPNRNMRTVWDITSGGGTKFEHYASYPVKLCETPIKAGCPEYICPKCGKARERMYNSIPAQSKECPKTQEAHEARGGTGSPVGTVGKSGSGRIEGETTFIGYSDCGCGTSLEDCVPGVVLDPFGGTGTTGYAAKLQGKKSILIDVSEDYAAMAAFRCLDPAGKANKNNRSKIQHKIP